MKARPPSVAVITGASRGLGAGLAERFCELGWSLGLCARTVPIASPGSNAVCEQVDVTDPMALASFASTVESVLGPIGLWINNAGVLEPIGSLRDAPIDPIAHHLAVNLGGVVNGTRLFASLVHDDADRRGTLINISSGAAKGVYPGWAVYGATKAAVDQLSRVVASEEARSGLAVFSVSPGVIDTDMQALIRASTAEAFPMIDRFRERKATGAFNTPAWVADRVLELHRSATSGLPDWARSGDDPVVLRVPDEPRERPRDSVVE